MDDKKISELTEYITPAAGDFLTVVDTTSRETKKIDFVNFEGATGPTGPTGPAGADGADGANAYVYIAYASDASGTGFTTTFNSALDYIAVLATDTEIVTPTVTDFAGLWKNYKGETGATGAAGADGTNGIDGVDGEDAYVYVAYASDDSGTGFTTTFNAALDYIAILPSNVEIPTPTAGDFTGLWKNYKGATGAPGAAGTDGADGVGVPVAGTTGQVLKKASNTDYDTEWGNASVVANLDDLTDVNAPTPSSGDVLTYNGTEWANGVGAGGAVSLISNEVPTGLINSSNTVFTTAHDFIATKIAVYLNRTRLKLTEDYTETAPNEITLNIAPTTGDDLWVDYVRSDSVAVGGTSERNTNEEPTGLVNGTNLIFTTSEPFISGSVEVFLNGMKQDLTTHYTESGASQITFVTAPQTGDSVRISYQTNLTPAGNADTLDGLHASDIIEASTQTTVLGYETVIGNQTGITTEVPVTGLSVTVDVPAGRSIKITASAVATSTVITDKALFTIKEGATQLQGFNVVANGLNANGMVILTPSAGTHTYYIGVARSGTGTVSVLSQSTYPAFILVELI